MVAAPAVPSSSLKDYLKRYQNSNKEEKKKKRKVVKSTSTSTSLLVVDEDPTWQKPVNLEDGEDNDSADEEKPQLKPFGSGFAETSKGSQSTDEIFDSSPLPRRRFDTPSPEHARKSDLSPPRKRKHDSQKPSLNFAASDADMSPPRKARQDDTSAPIQLATAGLITGKDVREEIAKTKKEELQKFTEMDPLMTGRGAEAVYRDRNTGEVISKEEYYLNSKKKQEQKQKPKEIKLEWSEGLAQKREVEAKLEELEREKEKPFARSREDPELDKMLKERVRFGDPMALLVKKKKQQEPVLGNLGDSEKMQESGFNIPQDIPSNSWIILNVHPPENRYGIKPGRHWDGVDRSIGFEKQMFQRLNQKQATKRDLFMVSGRYGNPAM